MTAAVFKSPALARRRVPRPSSRGTNRSSSRNPVRLRVAALRPRVLPTTVVATTSAAETSSNQSSSVPHARTATRENLRRAGFFHPVSPRHGIVCSSSLQCSAPWGANAQTDLDAFRYSQYSLTGTARFTSMGGAFTAVGGDFSSLSQNPAGMAIYRRSELTFTPSIYAGKHLPPSWATLPTTVVTTSTSPTPVSSSRNR